MPVVASPRLLGCLLLCATSTLSVASPTPPAPAGTPATTATPAANGAPPATTAAAPLVENKPLTAEQIAKNKIQQDAKTKALLQQKTIRLQQLEKANLDALAQNQELQLKNDNLGVQLQVLQSERSAQMFLYGAATVALGVLIGFLIASYIYTKRRRQW